MRIAVMGSGGVGGYFGARLAAAGVDVNFVARGEHLKAMQDDGLRIRSPLGDLHLPQVNATNDPSEIGPVDLVLFGVKLWDTEAAARTIKPLIGQSTALISFQNGVIKDEILKREIGAAHVIGGVCYIEAGIAEPGVIVHGNAMQRLVFGEYGGGSSSRVEAFLNACRSAGGEADVSQDISRTIWEKFIFRVALSGSTATVRMPIGDILGNAQSRELLRDLMDEAVAVSLAEGVNIAPGFVKDRIAFCEKLAGTMTSSMHRDLERGNPLEVGWLSGDVARRGAALGVATPVSRTVTNILAPHALGRARA